MNRGTEINHKQLIVLRCKLVFVGDATCGKTSLSQVFQSGGSTYPKNYMMVGLIPFHNLSVEVSEMLMSCFL